MTDVLASYRNSDTAPFLYCDDAPAFGVLNGIIQIELTAHSLSPGMGGTGVIVENIVTGHLRCTPAAARSLRAALDQALQMAEKPPEAPPESPVN